jgi:hypothetical protein
VRMNTGNPIIRRNQDPNYVAYFYDFGIIQRYLDSNNSTLARLNRGPPSVYDFSSDLAGKTKSHRYPTVEQIISNGYLAVPRQDPVKAMISDKKHTSWLGLDNIISQIRGRYELYQRNVYELDHAKCATKNSIYYHEAHHGPVDSKIEYSVSKRLDKLYKDQRDERVSLWQDISKLKLLLPENAQLYLAAYRKSYILEDSKGGLP